MQRIDALHVFQVEHGVLRAACCRARVLRVRELDRREHAAEHHFGAVRQRRPTSAVVCEQYVASVFSCSASGWLVR